MSRLQRYLDLPRNTNLCRSLKRPNSDTCNGCPLDPNSMCIFINEMNIWTPVEVEGIVERTLIMEAYPCPD